MPGHSADNLETISLRSPPGVLVHPFRTIVHDVISETGLLIVGARGASNASSYLGVPRSSDGILGAS